MTEQEFFTKNNCYKTTPDGSINTRCPYCGDSQKPNHLYNYGQAYVFSDGYFKCFKCGKYATAHDAIKQIAMNINVPVPTDILNRFKAKSIKYILTSNNKFDYYNNTEETFKKYHFKLDYIKQRLKLQSINPDTLNEYKFIIDLDPYYEQINKRFKSFEPNKYIGIMSKNNKKIIMRRIKDDNSGIRYINLSVDGTNEFDYYTTTTYKQDFFKYKTVVIGEGIFDVINTNTQTLFQGMYVATLSKTNIISTINKIFTEFLLKFNVIILKDRDVGNSYMSYVQRRTRNIVNDFKVYKNIADKDFGSDKVISKLEKIFSYK